MEKKMEKFKDIYADTKALFKTVIDGTDLDRVISIEILRNDKLKEIGKVSKSTDLVKFMTDIDVVIQLNELVFEQLDEVQQIIVAESLLAYISFNFETDRLTITKPDVMGHSGVISKFGDKLYLNTVEIIREVFNSAKQDKAETEA
jgi:hypothetical protein